MLEVGWSEILVIALILIIVVGPKELPSMLRTFGRMATRLRGMANEFRGQFDQALREAELDDVRKGLSEVNKLNPTNSLREAINPLRQLGQDIKSDLQKATDLKPDALVAKPEDKVPEPTTQLQTAEPVVAKVETVASKMETSVAEPVLPQPLVAAPMTTVVATDTPDIAVAVPAKKPARGKAAESTVVAKAPKAADKPKSAVSKAVVKKASETKAEAKAAEPKKAAPRKKAAKAGDA